MKHIPRPTLLTRLHDPRFRIVALVAPRGYGKTSLLQEATTHGIYVSTADAGGDALNIAAQIAAQFPQGIDSQLAYTRTHGTLTPLNAAAALRTDLATQPALTLALDDLHVLDDQARVFLMDHFLPRLPPNVRVLLGMRTDQHLRLSTLGLRVKLTTLTHADLSFTPEESQELGLTLDQHKQTQGWPELSLFVEAGGHPAEYVLAHTSTLSAELTVALHRAALIRVWRRQDPLHAKLDLPEGWLDAIREYVPCLETARGEYVPHSLYREILLEELRLRPSEYRAAKQAMGQAIAQTQPTAALDAFMEADAVDEACALIQTLTRTKRFRHSAEIAALYPMLQRLHDRLTPDLNVVYGVALFEAGRTGDGLQRVEQALLDGANPGPAYLTLAGLRLRNGNLALAQSYYQQALMHHPEPTDALDVRAQLAFSQATQAHTGLAVSLLEIEPEAEQVIRAGTAASPTATLLALTALTLALALRGNRAAAQVHLRMARDYPSDVIEPDDFSRACAALAQYAADDGDLVTAHTLLEKATQVLPSHTLQRHVHLSLTRAWIQLRTVDPESLRAALFGARGARSAAQDPPQLLEALTLNAVCLVFLHHQAPDRAALHHTELQHVLDELATAAAPYPAYQDTVVALRELARSTPDRPLGALRLGMAVPPQVQVLVALMLHARGSASVQYLALAELESLHDRWGKGTVHAAAGWFDLPLPQSRPVIQAELLTDQPRLTVNGQPLRLSEAQWHLMLALIFAKRTGVSRTQIPAMFGRPDDDSGVNLLYVTAKRLKNALRPLADLEEPLGTERGRYSLTNYLIQTDIDRLYITPTHQLPSVYLAPFMHHIHDLDLITVQREDCRELIRRRIAELHQTQPQRAAEVAQTLSARDPELMYSPLLQTIFPSTHALPALPEHS